MPTDLKTKDNKTPLRIMPAQPTINLLFTFLSARHWTLNKAETVGLGGFCPKLVSRADALSFVEKGDDQQSLLICGHLQHKLCRCSHLQWTHSFNLSGRREQLQTPRKPLVYLILPSSHKQPSDHQENQENETCTHAQEQGKVNVGFARRAREKPMEYDAIHDKVAPS